MAGMDSLFHNLSKRVEMARGERHLDRLVPKTFTSRTVNDWLMDCYTSVYSSVEYWFSHSLQQQSLLSVQILTFSVKPSLKWQKLALRH